MKTHQSDKPLVSVCMLCYNQEQYIEEAVNAMLVQTYSPLEIVVSDDCSTDRTWNILKKIQQEYQGPHKLIFHRNEKNKRIIRNLCSAFHLAHGELIIKADGDDISMPNRVEVMVEHWLQSGKQPWCMCSNYQKINVNGNFIGESSVPFTGIDNRSISEIVWGAGYMYLGAASAYRRDIIDYFPDAEYERACDDSVFTVRCSMLGKLYVVGDQLIKYRVGCGQTTGQALYRETLAKSIQYCTISQQQLLLDIEKIKDRLSPEVYNEYKKSLEDCYVHNSTVLLLWTGKTFKERLTGFKKSVSNRYFSLVNCISYILLLPPSVADFIFSVISKFKKKH